jgi:hypothetical protein
MADITIVDSRLFPSRKPERAGQMARLITYRVGADAKDTHIVIVESPSPSTPEIQAAIRGDMQIRDVHKLLKFTV